MSQWVATELIGAKPGTLLLAKRGYSRSVEFRRSLDGGAALANSISALTVCTDGTQQALTCNFVLSGSDPEKITGTFVMPCGDNVCYARLEVIYSALTGQPFYQIVYPSPGDTASISFVTTSPNGETRSGFQLIAEPGVKGLRGYFDLHYCRCGEANQSAWPQVTTTYTPLPGYSSDVSVYWIGTTPVGDGSSCEIRHYRVESLDPQPKAYGIVYVTITCPCTTKTYNFQIGKGISFGPSATMILIDPAGNTQW